jgi:hypothetical protein
MQPARLHRFFCAKLIEAILWKMRIASEGLWWYNFNGTWLKWKNYRKTIDKVIKA